MEATVSEPAASLPQKTAKSVLYELLQGNMAKDPPKFSTYKIADMGHNPIYESTVTVPGWLLGVSHHIPTVLGRGRGNSKRMAEHVSAQGALIELSKEPNLVWPDVHIPQRKPMPAFFPLPGTPPLQPPLPEEIAIGRGGPGAAAMVAEKAGVTDEQVGGSRDERQGEGSPLLDASAAEGALPKTAANPRRAESAGMRDDTGGEEEEEEEEEEGEVQREAKKQKIDGIDNED